MTRKKLLTLTSSICLVLILMTAILIAACSKPAPSPSPAPSPAPSPSPTPAPEPIVLKHLSFLPPFVHTHHFDGEFVKRIAERSNGELTIDWLGGPDVIPMFEQPNALTTGVIDMLNTATPFYEDRIPEAFCTFLSEITPMEERENGFYDWMVELHKEKMNAFYLGRSDSGNAFYWFTNKKVSKPQELAGQKVAASASLFAAAIEPFGGTPVMLAPTDYYTSLERGVVDGYIWPTYDAVGLGTWEVTESMIDHGFYDASDLFFLVNLDTWNKLPPHLQDLMKEIAIEIETELADFFGKLNSDNRLELIDLGLEMITFSEDDAEFYIDSIYQGGWDRTKGIVSPEAYDKLRKLLIK